MRLLLIADTHVPKRARDLPQRVWDEVARADVVVHAGDWVEPTLLDALEARADRLVACWGNNDGAELRARLPERADADLGGVRFTVVHETGGSAGREARMAKQYPDTDVLVFGHSHIPWDTTATTGLRLLNPGSPTDRRRQPFCTYMTAIVDDGELCRRHAAPPGTAPCVTVPAKVGDVHEIAAGMPHVKRIEGPKGNSIYQVGGKSFVFFRTPQPDAEDPDTGERYADVIMIWVESESDKLALIQDPKSPFFTTDRFDGHPSVLLRASDYARSASRS